MTDTNQDEILDLLSDPRRRQTIQILRQSPDGEIGFERLIDELIRRSGTKVGRRELAIQLHHKHLPKLAEGDLIAYDRDARYVQYRPDEEVEAMMDGIAPLQSPRAVED